MKRVLIAVLGFTALALPARAMPEAHAVAPAFVLPARNGSVALDSLRGRVVVVDFWASWCGPCRQSFPWMNSLQDRYGARGLSIVAVNLDKSRDLADRFLEQIPPRFTVAFDAAGDIAAAYRVKAMPTTVVIGPDGRILESHAGFDGKHAAELETRIAGALPR